MQLNRGDRVIERSRQGLWVRVGRPGMTGREGWVIVTRLGESGSYDDQLEIEAGPNGHFFVAAEVNGRTLNFMIDTGATTVALRPEDADMLGFYQGTLRFSERVRTANGIARVAPVTLDEITIGELTVRDVAASVLQRPMRHSLLGMSFLRRLDGYEVRGDRLVLKWSPGTLRASRETTPARRGLPEFVIEITGPPARKFRGTCRLINSDGEEVRRTIEGIAPDTYTVKARALRCTIRQPGITRGTLRIKLTINGRSKTFKMAGRSWITIYTKWKWN
jgi:aspartyl protease family protein